MNANQKLHQAKLQKWAAKFAEQKASGLTVRQWCEINHVSFHTYSYWKYLLKEEVVDQALPDIVPLSIPAVPDLDSSLEVTELRSIRSNCSIQSNDSLVKLGINGLSIEIEDSISEEFLAKLIKAVCYALKMLTLFISPVSILSVVTQIFDMALIRLLPSLNANTIGTCSFLTHYSFSA